MLEIARGGATMRQGVCSLAVISRLGLVPSPPTSSQQQTPTPTNSLLRKANTSIALRVEQGGLEHDNAYMAKGSNEPVSKRSNSGTTRFLCDLANPVLSDFA